MSILREEEYGGERVFGAFVCWCYDDGELVLVTKDACGA